MMILYTLLGAPVVFVGLVLVLVLVYLYGRLTGEFGYMFLRKYMSYTELDRLTDYFGIFPMIIGMFIQACVAGFIYASYYMGVWLAS